MTDDTVISMTDDIVTLQIAEEQKSSKQKAAEEELRRSIEARMNEPVKEEKLKLSKKALELGKQKVSLRLALTAHLLLALSAHGEISTEHALIQETFPIIRQLH